MTNPVTDWKNSRRDDSAVADLDGVEAVTAYGPIRDEMEARYLATHLDAAAVIEATDQPATSVADAEYVAAETWGDDATAFTDHSDSQSDDHGL